MNPRILDRKVTQSQNHSKQTTLMTGCYSQKDVPNVESTMKDGPYGRVCPITLDTGFLAVNHDDSKWIKPNGTNWEGDIIRYESGDGFHFRFFKFLLTDTIHQYEIHTT